MEKLKEAAPRKEYTLKKGLTQAGKFIEKGKKVKLTEQQAKRLQNEYI